MSSVYSSRVMAVHGTEPVSYTVPTGKRLVVRWITAFNPDPVLGATAQLVHDDSGCTVYQKDLSAQVWDGTDCRFVANEGESLTARSDNSADITVSGYLLTLP